MIPKNFPGIRPQLLSGAIFVFALLCSHAQAQHDSYYGHFVGELELTPVGMGSDMRLLKPYTFIDSSGGTWYAPAGTISDGASIPPVAKRFVGGSWDGPYRLAAVLHDVACVQKNRPWDAVHLMFYHAMLAAGVAPLKAKLMYMGVYHFGPRWDPIGQSYTPTPKLSPQRAIKLAELEQSGSQQVACGRTISILGVSIPSCDVGSVVHEVQAAHGTPSSSNHNLAVYQIEKQIILDQASNEEFAEMAKIISDNENLGKGLTEQQIQKLRP